MDFINRFLYGLVSLISLENFIILAYIVVISLFLYSIYAVRTYKSKMRERIMYLLETVETEDEIEELRLTGLLYNKTFNAAVPMLVAMLFVLLPFIIAPFDFEHALILFFIAVLLISPICLISMAILCELNIKTRHKYGVYDRAEDAKDHALASLALFTVASNAKKFAGSGKRQLDYFKNKKIQFL
ncbi:hypothetical protein [uncultured Treponema sp.]|uniref:hypothetical protein n=1 Tax=uncultured Treponema sp. TaxID=162155 RepID=UPI0025ECBF2B|nr:hypothetical protein [uncultured Treponema sp.]